VADLPLSLPAFDRLEEVEGLLEQLPAAAIGTAAELEATRRALAIARERLSSHTIMVSPIHGDAHLGNILRTPGGPIWGDLENVCAGPIEYDLACTVWRERVHRDTASKRVLAGYGEHDPELLEALLPTLGVFLAAWTIVIARRNPSPRALALLRERIAYVHGVCGPSSHAARGSS